MSTNEQITELMRLVAIVADEAFSPDAEEILAIEAHACKMVEGEPATQLSDADTITNILAWVDSRIEAEVTHRPDVNVHKRTLSETWNQVRRHLQEKLKEAQPAPPAIPAGPIQEFERILLAGGEMGAGDATALYEMPETPQEAFAAGWNRRHQLAALVPQTDHFAVMQQALDAITFLAKVANVSHNEYDSVRKSITALRQALAASKPAI